MLDAGCGDYNWLKEVVLPLERYVGIDIVPELIARDRELYGRPGREFMTCDITRDVLPRVSLILCRDCLIHLSFADCLAALQDLKRSGSPYLLATTHPSIRTNRDIRSGAWRSLNLRLPPFGFPEPARQLTENTDTGKALALWRFADLSIE